MDQTVQISNKNLFKYQKFTEKSWVNDFYVPHHSLAQDFAARGKGKLFQIKKTKNGSTMEPTMESKMEFWKILSDYQKIEIIFQKQIDIHIYGAYKREINIIFSKIISFKQKNTES